MDDELLTIDEAAGYLKVSRATVYNWIARRGLPIVNAGTLIRIRRSELNAWLERERPANQGAA